MKIAHIILAHTDPNQFKRLALRLSEFSDVYVFLNNKSGIEDFRVSKDNIYFIEERFNVCWEALSSVKAVLLTLEQAVKLKYDRYTFMTGLDYPIKNNKEIIQFYESNSLTNFVSACKVTDSSAERLRNKVQKIWFLENRGFFKRMWNFLSMKINYKAKKDYLIENGVKIEIYFGSNLVSVTHNVALWFIQFYKNNPKLIKYLNCSYSVDELYFATAFYNSPYKNSAQENSLLSTQGRDRIGTVELRNLHYYEYPKFTRIFTLQDYDLLINKKRFIC